MFVIHVMNDIHGAKPLIDAVVTAIGQMRRGDTVIINGDGTDEDQESHFQDLQARRVKRPPC